MELARKCVETARRRGLATNGARRVDTSLTDVLPTAMWQHFRSSSCRQRARSRSVSTIVPETSEFSGVETGTRVRDSRRCVANHDMSRRLSRPLCERLASSQPLGAHVMKSFLALTLAAAPVGACTKTEPPQADSAQPPSSRAQPASPQSAAPPPAVTSPAPAAESAQAPAAQKSAAPAKPAPSSPATSASTAAAPPPSAAPAPPPKPVEPPPPPPPVVKEFTVPAGTSLAVTVLSNLGSETSQVEDVVKGSLAKPIVIDGTTVAPQGAEVRGVVSDAKKSGRVKGKASLGIAFDRLTVRGETLRMQTAPVVLEAQDKKSDDVKKGGLGAGLGAVVGGIAGGGSGAAIGAVAGGAGTVLATKGREVEIPAGTVVNVLLQSPLTLKVTLKQQPQ